MSFQCGFIDYNKCNTVVEDIDNGGGHAYVRAGGLWEICYLLHCTVNLKLLSKVFFFNVCPKLFKYIKFIHSLG